MRYYVYFIQCCGFPYYKVGISDNPKLRLKTLQGGCPFQLKLVKKISYKWREDAFFAEAWIHQSLKDEKIRGEWYELKYFEQMVWNKYKTIKKKRG